MGEQIKDRHLHYTDSGEPILLSGNRKHNKPPVKTKCWENYLWPYYEHLEQERKWRRN